MKIGKQLRHHAVPEWQAQYLNYKKLKKQLKKAAREKKKLDQKRHVTHDSEGEPVSPAPPVCDDSTSSSSDAPPDKEQKRFDKPRTPIGAAREYRFTLSEVAAKLAALSLHDDRTSVSLPTAAAAPSGNATPHVDQSPPSSEAATPKETLVNGACLNTTPQRSGAATPEGPDRARSPVNGAPSSGRSNDPEELFLRPRPLPLELGRKHSKPPASSPTPAVTKAPADIKLGSVLPPVLAPSAVSTTAEADGGSPPSSAPKGAEQAMAKSQLAKPHVAIPQSTSLSFADIVPVVMCQPPTPSARRVGFEGLPLADIDDTSPSLSPKPEATFRGGSEAREGPQPAADDPRDRSAPAFRPPMLSRLNRNATTFSSSPSLPNARVAESAKSPEHLRTQMNLHAALSPRAGEIFRVAARPAVAPSPDVVKALKAAGITATAAPSHYLEAHAIDLAHPLSSLAGSLPPAEDTAVRGRSLSVGGRKVTHARSLMVMKSALERARGKIRAKSSESSSPGNSAPSSPSASAPTVPASAPFSPHPGFVSHSVGSIHKPLDEFGAWESSGPDSPVGSATANKSIDRPHNKSLDTPNGPRAAPEIAVTISGAGTTPSTDAGKAAGRALGKDADKSKDKGKSKGKGKGKKSNKGKDAKGVGKGAGKSASKDAGRSEDHNGSDSDVEDAEGGVTEWLLDYALPDVKQDKKFFDMLRKELDKINKFFRTQATSTALRYQAIEQQVAALMCGDLPEAKRPDGSIDAYAIKRAARVVKQAFVEFYKVLHFVENYSVLNLIGFAEILRKRDKKMGTLVRPELLSRLELEPFSAEVSALRQLQADAESVYIETFEGGDKKKGIQALRVQDGTHTKHSESFLVGLYLGIMLVLAMALALLVREAGDRSVPMPESSAMFMCFRGPFIMIVLIWLFGVNVLVWWRRRINFIFLMDMKPKGALMAWEYFELAGLMSVVWLSCVVLYYMSALDLLSVPWMPPEYHPLTLVAALLLLLVSPLKLCHRSARMWLLRVMGRIFAAPGITVLYKDFFIADIFLSMPCVFFDAVFLICYYSADLGNGSSHCTTANAWVRPVVSILLNWFRLAQCLRRWRDAKWARLHPQLVNAGKYASGFPEITFGALADRFEPGAWGPLRTMWLFSALFTLFYKLAWDLKMDWSLLDPQSSPRYLRKERLLPTSVYFAVPAINLLLRAAPMVLVTFKFYHVWWSEYTVTLAAVLELWRRMQWTIMRMENEQVSNAEWYRVVKLVPKPYVLPEDEEDDVHLEAPSLPAAPELPQLDGTLLTDERAAEEGSAGGDAASALGFIHSSGLSKRASNYVQMSDLSSGSCE